MDENNAYAVGEFYYPDTIDGRVSHRKYNAARWDGIKWHFEVISPGSPEVDSNLERQTTLRGVWGEKPNNYTFTSSNQIVYHDGSSAVTDLYFWAKQDSQSCRQMWGPENDRWFYGPAGWITRGEGRSYTKQPRLTSARITGLCANQSEVWAVAGYWRNDDRAVLRYYNGQWIRMNDSLQVDDKYCTEDVWCDNIGYARGGFLGFVGSSIVYYDSAWSTIPRALLPSNKFFHGIHGSGRNNVFVVGKYGIIVHFNGNSWITYPELYNNSVLYYDVVVSGSKIFAVGAKGAGLTYGYITVGTRIGQ